MLDTHLWFNQQTVEAAEAQATQRIKSRVRTPEPKNQETWRERQAREFSEITQRVKQVLESAPLIFISTELDSTLIAELGFDSVQHFMLLTTNKRRALLVETGKQIGKKKQWINSLHPDFEAHMSQRRKAARKARGTVTQTGARS